MSKEKSKKGLNRRDFIKGAAVGAGAIALSGLGLGAAKAASPPEKWDYEADVVVVGLGAAGAAASIEAHDAGAKVLVVEKQPENAHYSNSRMSGGSAICADSSGDRKALKQYLKAMMSAENLPWMLEGAQPDESDEVVEMFAQYATQTIDFLQSLDSEAEVTGRGGPAYPWFPGAEESGFQSTSVVYPEVAQADPNAPPYELPKLQKKSGESLMWCLKEEGVKSRGIDILYSSPAKRLVEKDGEILGVIAEKGGREIACKANKGVILTSGGFEYNAAMRRAFLEGPGVKGWAFIGSPDNTGDGIAMAMAVGAGLAKVGKAASRVVIAVPYGRGYEETGLKMGQNASGALRGNPHTFLVDNYGKRYANETLLRDNPWRYSFYKKAVHYEVLAQDYPRIPSWDIFDETVRSTEVAADWGKGTIPFRFIPWTLDNLDAINRGWILKGDTIEELAAKIKNHPDNKNKMDAETLVETANTFNSYCAAGKDLEFSRDPARLGPVETPPFYAIPLYAGGPNTKGGIMADGQRHVLTWEGKPIPRLYTAGEISSAFKFAYQAGGNLGECIAFGRLAGKNAVAEKPWG